MSFAQISDGLSNTFLAGEAFARQRPTWGGTAPANWLGIGKSPGNNGAHGAAITRTIDYPPNPLDFNWRTYGFASAHPNGVGFVMCDGSTCFIEDTVEFGTGPYRVYQKLGIRNDGLDVSVP